MVWGMDNVATYRTGLLDRQIALNVGTRTVAVRFLGCSSPQAMQSGVPITGEPGWSQ